MSGVQFGYCVPIFANPSGGLFRTPNYAALDAGTTMRAACRAEELGYDSLWVADHLMLGKDEAILEGWTVLSALAGATRRARLGIIHMAHPFRQPAIVAKMTATLDQISGGRLIHFVDCGRNEREYRAYGVPLHEQIGERIAEMIEGIEITLALWGAGKPVNYQGRRFALKEAVGAPQPVQRPHPPIWLGETDQQILEACARFAQGWNTTPVSVAELERRLAALAAACNKVGRPYADVEKSLEIQVLVAPDRATLRERLRELVSRVPAGQAVDPQLTAFVAGQTDQLPASVADTWLIGTPDEVAQRIRAYTALGVSHFMLWFVDVPREDSTRLFAEQVAPRFR